MLDFLVDRVHLRQAEGGDEGADQAVAGQVDAFTEGAAEHGEADAPGVGMEATEETQAFGLAHAARLRPHRNVRMLAAEAFQRLFQIGVAAEERQIVAGTLGELPGHQCADRAETGVAVLVAGRQVAQCVHLQLLGAERRFHVQPGGAFRQAEQVGVIVRGAQGGGEQRGAVGRFEALGEEGRRHDIAQAQGRLRPPAGAAVHRDVEQRMRPVGLGQAAEQHGVEVEAQQPGIVAGGMVGQVIGDRGDDLLQGGDEQVRHHRVDAVGLFLFLVELVPVAADAIQRAFQRGRAGLAQGVEFALVQFRAVHAAAALDQVVRLVHQQRHAPVVEHGEAVEQGGHVEVVVVVADHHIGPAAQLLAQVVGADLMGEGDFANLLLGHPAPSEDGLPRRRQTVVETLGQRTGVAVAGLVRMLAGLVAGDVFQHPQRHLVFLTA
ncbi:hypothetical protein D3C81_1012080 [compost metagenome]